MTERKTYSPDDFVAELKSGGVGTSAALSLTGMVKPGDDDQHLLFAIGTSCETWTQLPVAMIESIELHEVVPCRDHTHPLVELKLNEPDSHEAKVFGALAKAHSPAGAYQASPRAPTPGFFPTSNFALRWLEEETETGRVTPSKDACIACFKGCRVEGLDFFQCVNLCFPLCPG